MKSMGHNSFRLRPSDYAGQGLISAAGISIAEGGKEQGATVEVYGINIGHNS